MKGGSGTYFGWPPLEDFFGTMDGVARIFPEIPVPGQGDQNHDHPLHHVRRDEYILCLVIVEKPSSPSPGLMPLRTAPESDCLQPSVLLMGLLDRENLMNPDDPRLFVNAVKRGICPGNMKPVYLPAAP